MRRELIFCICVVLCLMRFVLIRAEIRQTDRQRSDHTLTVSNIGLAEIWSPRTRWTKTSFPGTARMDRPPIILRPLLVVRPGFKLTTSLTTVQCFSSLEGAELSPDSSVIEIVWTMFSLTESSSTDAISTRILTGFLNIALPEKNKKKQKTRHNHSFNKYIYFYCKISGISFFCQKGQNLKGLEEVWGPLWSGGGGWERGGGEGAYSDYTLWQTGPDSNFSLCFNLHLLMLSNVLFMYCLIDSY